VTVEETWAVAPPSRVEKTARHIRVRVGDEVVADSRRALFLCWYGPGRLPTYAVPARDVRTELLRPSAGGGVDAAMIDHDIHVGDRVIEHAAKLLAELPDELRRAEGYWTFSWDDGVRWFEEAQEAHVHARDPQHRVDAIPSDRHVKVLVDGVVVAESGRPTAVFETHLPVRWYLPAEDVDQSVLTPTTTVSRCPYKGEARYWSVRAGDTEHADLVWSYPDPIAELPGVKGLLCFFDEHVDMVIDGVKVPRPVTPWS
jgi:uncharacterized protein (DUF427 family)